MQKHILLVFPNTVAYLRDFCLICLEEAGYRVTCASSQEEGECLFVGDGNHFDLVITNKTLEDRDSGMRLMGFIHEIFADFPCMLLTSGPGMVEVKDCDRVLYKPFKREELVRIAAELIRDAEERNQQKFKR